MLKELSITGLRGFGEKKTIIFSLPNGEEGSGLNIIVGPNNSGKTTIVEAIQYYNSEARNISFSEGKRNSRTNSKVDIIYLDDNSQKFEVHTTEYGGSQVATTGKINAHSVPYILPSRRFTEYNMHNPNYSTDRNIYSMNQVQFFRNRGPNINQFEQRIFKWQKDKDKFDEYLKQIITEPFNWIIEQNDDGAYYIKIVFSDQSISHTREGTGDGFWSIFTIIDSLYDSKKGDIIVIDEPELSLHPAFQKKVIELLEKFSKDRQIILTTHSPYFISLYAISNGGGLIRTFKNEAGNIDIGYLNDENRKSIKSFINDLNNPHILGHEAKELFFIEDNIVITEGQEDVIIIPKICSYLGMQLEANLFGWGAGGAGNISKILDILRSLGYRKVTAIFDGDKEDEYKICENKFKEYNIKILFKDDIRDKDETHTNSKSGVAYKSGELKEENKKDMLKFLEQINDYHQKQSSEETVKLTV